MVIIKVNVQTLLVYNQVLVIYVERLRVWAMVIISSSYLEIVVSLLICRIYYLVFKLTSDISLRKKKKSLIE